MDAITLTALVAGPGSGVGLSFLIGRRLLNGKLAQIDRIEANQLKMMQSQHGVELRVENIDTRVGLMERRE